MKIAWIVLAVIFFLLLLMAFGGGYYMYRFAILRGKKGRDYWEENLSRQDFFTPEEWEDIQKGEAFIKAHATEKVEITSRDGLKLRGRIIENEDPVGMIVMVHGYRSHPILDFSCAAEAFYRYGFSMLMIQHRAHGDSEGKHICFGVKESEDLCLWADMLRQRYPGLPVIFDGVSMGGATVMMSAGEELPSNVKGLIADCGYTTPADICKKCLREWFHLPPFPVYYGAALWTRLLGGFSLSGKSSVQALRKLAEKEDHPCLVIAHGRADDFVPYTMAEACRAALPKDDRRVWMVTSETAGHGMTFLKDREAYVKALREMYATAGIEIRG